MDEQSSGFSTNTLLATLRSIIQNNKNVLSVEQIQEIMNIITDLEYEYHLLQTNYDNVSKQHELITNIDSNILTIIDSISSNDYDSSHDPLNSDIDLENDTVQHQDSV